MPSLNVARYFLQVIWLKDGRLFTIGGFDNDNKALNTVEMMTRVWNSGAEQKTGWHLVAPMLNARCLCAAVLIHNVIIVAGGRITGDQKIASVEIFTPPAADDQQALGQWTNVQPMQSPTESLGGVFYGGEVLVFGTFIFYPK